MYLNESARKNKIFHKQTKNEIFNKASSQLVNPAFITGEETKDVTHPY